MAKDKPITMAGIKASLKDVIVQETKDGGSISQAVGRIITKETKAGGAIYKAVTEGVSSLALATQKELKKAVSKKDFDELKEKVEFHHPTN